MGTTAGSWALVGAKATHNSAIAQKLINAGLIILGKANMTLRSHLAAMTSGAADQMTQKFAGMKMTMMMPGWSARGGQTLSPYVSPIEEGETLLGHSVSWLRYP